MFTTVRKVIKSSSNKLNAIIRTEKDFYLASHTRQAINKSMTDEKH